MDCKFKTGDCAVNKLTGEKVIIHSYTLEDVQYNQLSEVCYYHSDGSRSYGSEEVFFTEIEYKQLVRNKKLKSLLL